MSKKEVRDNWQTPDHLAEMVRRVGHGIGLDPCAGKDTNLADTNWKVSKDGLRWGWTGYGLVYVYPPQSSLKAWVHACVEEARKGAEIILLLPSRTDSRVMHEIFDTAQAVCFWKGRIKFIGAKGVTELPAPWPNVAVYWGDRQRVFKRVFSEAGKVFYCE